MSTPEYLTDYHVGIVTSPCGVNIHQVAEIQHRISFIARHLDAGKVHLHLLGFNLRTPELGIANHLLNLRYRDGVRQVTCMPSGRMGVPVNEYLARLTSFDEVWCVPGPGQATIASRTRVAKIYRAGVALQHPGLFKLIPTWIPAQPAATKKLKKRNRAPWE